MVGEPSHVKQLSLNHVCKIGLKREEKWVFRKIRPSPILWERLPDSVPLCTAVDNSKTNFQCGNEIHSDIANSRIMLTFWVKQTSPPPPPPFNLLRQAFYKSIYCILYKCSKIHATQALSRSCQHCGTFIALLPISVSVHSAIASREKHIVTVKTSLRRWLQIPNLFTSLLPTAACFE